jgi:hypothetical protein
MPPRRSAWIGADDDSQQEHGSPHPGEPTELLAPQPGTGPRAGGSAEPAAHPVADVPQLWVWTPATPTGAGDAPAAPPAKRLAIQATMSPV